MDSVLAIGQCVSPVSSVTEEETSILGVSIVAYFRVWLVWAVDSCRS